VRKARRRPWTIWSRSFVGASERPLHIEVSDLARAQIRAAQDWWRINRPKAPNPIREELERASLLISVQPEIPARARSISLPGVKKLVSDKSSGSLPQQTGSEYFLVQAITPTDFAASRE